MAASRITITLPEDQLEEIRKGVAAGQFPSVSDYVKRAVQKSLQLTSELRELLDQGLIETGGPTTAKERAWARKMMQPRKKAKPARRRKAA